jgi:hypothetical protein
VKENNWKRKTANPVACTNVILTIESAPNASRNTAGNENGKCKPQASAGVLASQPPKQCDECPDTQGKEKYDRQNTHA